MPSAGLSVAFGSGGRAGPLCAWYFATRVLDLSVGSVRSEDEVENEVELSKTSISDSSSEVSEILGFPRLEPGQHGMG